MRHRSPILERLIAGLRPTVHDTAFGVVGELQDYVLGLFPIRTTARSVWIKPSTVEHIEDRRRRHITPGDDESAVERDVIFVLRHMAAVIIRPTYWGAYPGDPCKFALAGSIEGEGRCLRIAIKFVWPPYSETGGEEAWVSTGWPMGHGSLRRDLKRGRLVRVSSG